MGRMPPVLRMRLGEEAAHALEDHAEVLGSHWREEVMQTAADRFDSRLTTVAADLRLEMQKGFAQIWQAMADLRVSIRQELADTRVESLRWSFLFWIGQVVAVASLLAFMLRGVAPR